MERQSLIPEVTIDHPLVRLSCTKLPELPESICKANSVWHNGRLYFGGGAATGVTWQQMPILYSYTPGDSKYGIIDTPTYFYGLTVYQGHLVLVGGLYPEDYIKNKASDKVWQLQQPENEWKESAIPPMLTPRYGVCAVGHHELLIAAGGENNSEKSSSVEIYSSTLQKWKITADLPQPSSFMSSAVMFDSYLLFAGGRGQANVIWQCNIDDLKSSKVAKPWGHHDQPRNVPLKETSITSHQDVLLAVGGKSDLESSSAVYSFLPHTNFWYHCFDLPQPLSATSVSISPSGDLFCIGGHELGVSNSTKVFQLSIKDRSLAISFSNIILKGVQSGLLASFEKDLTIVMDLYSHSSQLQPDDGNPLLDFLAYSPNYVAEIGDSKTFSPLIIASANDNTKMMDFLLKNGASPLYRNKTGLTPLLTACSYGNVAAVELLVTHDLVDISVCDKNGQGALHQAVKNDSSSIVELLLQKGCPSDAKDSEGNTPLHIAYKRSSSSVINILTQVDNGSLEQIPNKIGQLPADVSPIPPEIMKKGPKAINMYHKALLDGERKIPLCKLLVLGEEEVGKTSLYRLLVQKGFDPKQDSTRGIDNCIVDTLVDTRHVGVEDWTEKDESTVQQYADQQFVKGVIGALQLGLLKLIGTPTASTLTESELDDTLSELLPKIEQILTAKMDETSNERNEPISPLGQNDGHVSANNTSASKKEKKSTKQQSNEVDKPSDFISSVDDDKAGRVVPKVSNWHAKLINDELVSTATSKDLTEPTLMFNVLDFAGQKNYRPMHHCFLIRRALYLLVFNLQHFIPYLEQTDAKVIPPIEEIRYWLHSIHVHTVSGKAGQEKGPIIQKNVCLVGTHRAPNVNDPSNRGRVIKKDELKKINKMIFDRICNDDDRCSSHLHHMGPDGETVFAAVENSIDGHEIEDRKKSGAKALQEEILEVSQRFAFLREKYPITWLNFESKLTEFKKSLITTQGDSSPPPVKVKEVIKLAEMCGITVEEMQHLALEFYHETGKIVYLKLLPSLYITEEEHDELKDLVLLDPTWLIHLMTNVMELNNRSPIEGKLINRLRETGVASSDLLKEAWSDYLRQEPLELSFRQMCLMLQAEALIHPISESMLAPEEQSKVDLEAQSPGVHLPTCTTQYLVPGKLPKKAKKKPVQCSGWRTFYFDFQKFLPEEIYHRLICLMLAVTQKKKLLDIDKPYLSKDMCLFKRIDKSDWCIEIEREEHRLKISVLSNNTDPRKPTHHIQTMHTEYLRKICTLSNFEGLRYVGGPLLDPCGNCKQIVVVRYVFYYEGEDRPSESMCPNCNITCDVCQLLEKNQVKVKEAHQCDVQLPTPIASGTQKVDSDSFSSAPPPNLQNLTLIKWKSHTGENKRCRVIRSIAHKWNEVGRLLGISGAELESIPLKNLKDPELCCTDVINKWLNNPPQNRPISWGGILELLEDIDETALAEDLKMH